MIKQICEVYADKSYDAQEIRKDLSGRNIKDCIPYRKNNKHCNESEEIKYNKIRYVVERFFAWLKCGFHRIRIRSERRSENYLGFVNVASIMMYGRVLG